ncbi:cytosolic phospholipase A2 gamma-like isoform X2 [Hemicordylus capensis]|uniref:cytosolic phospholipase A2 gamma-like isoform X2 n=1 Tax=Hemicordylus capensis TaxID=884348 RepID=UPI0023046F96|nr:cytosolic phospholipase A2 gamma-like isoform X2 [Hemicordylus capensis]
MAKTAVMEASKDELYSLTDFWSYFIVHKLLKEFDESELSAHRRCCETGKNPYPIYAAVDKETCEEQNTGTWFEFTPHEAGVPGLGAYVDIKHFGSIFEKGQLYEKKKGKNICYLQGLWGSALGSEKELIQTMSAFHSQDDQDIGILGWAYLAVLELLLCSSDEKTDEKLFDNLESILKDHSGSKSYGLVQEMRQIWLSLNPEKRKKECMILGEALDIDFGASGDHFHTMVKKTLSCLWGWTWGSTNNFLYQCSDVKLPELTDKQVVSLIDAGLAINTAYPLVLRPERQAKLILSFDFSAGDPFETIKKAAEYCKEHGLPFPKIDEIELQDTDDPSDCYIFKGENAPTVMHFPLFNKFNCPGKVAEYRDQFGTFKMSYSEEEIEKLLTAAKKNVAHNHQKILEEIKHVACPLSRKA